MPTVTQTPLFVALLVSIGLQCALAQAQIPAVPSNPAATAADITHQDPTALAKSAEAAMQAKDWSQALGRWDEYLALKPDDAYGYRMRGSVLRELGRSDGAIAAYRQSTKLAPANPNGWNGLCWTYILLNKPQDARPHCNKSVELEPGNYAASVNLGHTYLLQGDSKTAQEWYQKTLPNITSEAQLKDGPLADFDIFIGKGWQVQASSEAKAWFEKEGAAWLARWKPASEMLEQANAAEAKEDFARAYTLREQRLPLLIALLGQDHQRLKDAREALSAIGGQWAVQQLEAAVAADKEQNYVQALTLMEQSLQLYIGAGAYDELLPSVRNTLTTLRLKLAEHLFAQANYAEALPLYQQVLADQEVANGPDSTQAAVGLNYVARALNSMGRYADALPLYTRALAISEKAEGPEHPSTGTRLNNLAGLYVSMGRYADALPLYTRALAISEKAQGHEHPRTGNSLNNLASLYEAMGRYADALPLYTRALAISEKAQGPEHPETGIRLNNLGGLHYAMGRYADALPLYVRALAISEKAEGPEHPGTGTSLNNLASLYGAMGQYARAEPLYTRALAISEKAEGPEHPSTGTRLNNLAGLYVSMGRYADALPFFTRALAISEKAQGPVHPETGTSLAWVATVYQSMGRYADALPFFTRALAISEKANGPEHPTTGIHLNNLAGLYVSLDQATHAEPLYQRAWRITSKAGGPEPAWTVQGSLRHFYAKTKPDLAIWYGKQAVNTLQSVRAGNSALDKDTQKSFLQKNENSYKSLVDLLFAQGRLLEGQQVLAMLKEAEYFDFLQRSSPADPRKTQADYTEQERPWSERYTAISSQLAAMSEYSGPT